MRKSLVRCFQVVQTSANSRHLFDNGQMWFIGAPKMGTNAFSQLLGREHSIRLHDGLLRMDPLRFNRVEPGALCGEQERQDTYPLTRPLDLLIVGADPGAHGLALMPGGI